MRKERKVLTDAQLRKIKPAAPGQRDSSKADALVPGLEVRVTDKGHASYVLRMRPRGRPSKRWTIGQVGTLSLPAARAKAREWIAEITAGRDPKYTRTEPDNFANVAQEFIQRHLAGKRTAAVVEYQINKELIPIWGMRDIRSITQRDVVDLLEVIKDRGNGTGAYARNIWIHINNIFSRAIARGILETSPCDRVKPKVVIGQRKIRDRVLTDSELRAIWNAATEYPVGSMVRWLVLTGARLNEGRSATWAEFDNGLWTIPRERFKSDAVHLVPLTSTMQEFLGALPRWSRGNFLFTVVMRRMIRSCCGGTFGQRCSTAKPTVRRVSSRRKRLLPSSTV
jgi:integrase